MYRVNEEIKKEDEEILREKVVTVYGEVQLKVMRELSCPWAQISHFWKNWIQRLLG